MVNIAISRYLAAVVFGIGIAVVSASVVEHFLKVPLFEIGGLWVKAIEDLVTNLQGLLDTILQFKSLLMLGAAVGIYVLYHAYFLVFGRMNRIRLLHEVGYCTDGKLSTKEVCDNIKRKRKIGDCPPCYPNGWFSVIDSHDLKVNESKSVSCLGKLFLLSISDIISERVI